MMTDLRHIGSPPKNKRVASNKLKVKKEPVDLRKISAAFDQNR